jgi:hypothetical protein
MFILCKLNRYIIEKDSSTSLQRLLFINTLCLASSIMVHSREIILNTYKPKTFNQIQIHNYGNIHLIRWTHSNFISNDCVIVSIQMQKNGQINVLYQIGNYSKNILYRSKFNVYDFIITHDTYYRIKYR